MILRLNVIKEVLAYFLTVYVFPTFGLRIALTVGFIFATGNVVCPTRRSVHSRRRSLPYLTRYLPRYREAIVGGERGAFKIIDSADILPIIKVCSLDQ